MSRGADPDFRRQRRLARLSLSSLLSRVFTLVRDSPELQALDLDLYAGSYDDETITLRGFAPDPAAARAALHLALGPEAAGKVELTIDGPARVVVRNVPWESWTTDAAGTQITIQLYDHTKGRGLRAIAAETDDDVTITLRGPRSGGLAAAIAIPIRRTVRLAAPVSDRQVRDGADGRRPPRNDDFAGTDPRETFRQRSSLPPDGERPPEAD